MVIFLRVKIYQGNGDDALSIQTLLLWELE